MRATCSIHFQVGCMCAGCYWICMDECVGSPRLLRSEFIINPAEGVPS